MRFSEFLRTTVMMSAGSAAVLALITLVEVDIKNDQVLAVVSLCWWFAAIVIGLASSRQNRTSPPIARLLSSARTQMSLPELHPTRTLLNRLWPLILITFVACGCVFFVPQVPAIAAGFAAISALGWRRQPLAVTAIEQRDGARFYVERTSPIATIKLVRTPGFRTHVDRLDEVPG